MIKIKNEELIRELVGKVHEFPKYTTQILNLANQNAQGTRPRVVGQLSELIKESRAKTYGQWKGWYLNNYPDAIQNASQMIEGMMPKLRDALLRVDKKIIKEWVEDLVLEKTFIGLRFQEAILKKVASLKKTGYRLSNPMEESKGIDGFIGDTAVSIKPITYKTKGALREKIDAEIIFYDKVKDGIEIDAAAVL